MHRMTGAGIDTATAFTVLPKFDASAREAIWRGVHLRSHIKHREAQAGNLSKTEHFGGFSKVSNSPAWRGSFRHDLLQLRTTNVTHRDQESDRSEVARLR